MSPGPDALALAEALERAYRLALAGEALADGPASHDQAISGILGRDCSLMGS